MQSKVDAAIMTIVSNMAIVGTKLIYFITPRLIFLKMIKLFAFTDNFALIRIFVQCT